jgi:hypothetical protein
VVGDLLIHEADLSGALGVADAPPAEAVAWVLDFALGDLGRRIDEAGLAGLRIALDGDERIVGQMAPGRTVVAVPSWELFRSLAGRRSLEQVRRYAWDGDPDPYLAVWNRYGQLPVDGASSDEHTQGPTTNGPTRTRPARGRRSVPDPGSFILTPRWPVPVH